MRFLKILCLQPYTQPAVQSLANGSVVTNSDYRTNKSKLLLMNTSMYTVEHDCFGTARWQNLY